MKVKTCEKGVIRKWQNSLIIDGESPLLLPYDLIDWIPKDHIVHFILKAVEMVNLNSFRINHKGSGIEQYPRHICGGNERPGHDIICVFRRNNDIAFKDVFLKYGRHQQISCK